MTVVDLGPWEPLPLQTVLGLLEGADVPWWVSGGHALELYLDGLSWREHDDIDVSIRRDHAPALHHLLRDWDLYIAAAGELTSWNGSDLCADTSQNNVWCRTAPDQPWCLDITISDGDDQSWIYRRDPTVVVPWHQAVVSNNAGTHYLAPELQLLYKSKDPRPKDHHDAQVVVPALRGPARSWLAQSLAGGHPWQRLLGRERATDALDRLGLDAHPEFLAEGKASHAWRLLTPDLDHLDLVIRTPIANSGRAASYRSEALIGDQLVSQGAPVAAWQLVEDEYQGETCSIGTFMSGDRVFYGDDWTPDFATEVAGVLHKLHTLPVAGFGPLIDTDEELRGQSNSLQQGVVDRWQHAAIWPFDDSSIKEHVLQDIDSTAGTIAWSYRDAIVDAATGPVSLVHSDLHRDHLLVGPDGTLTAVLDFGAAFVGSPAWEFASLRWYYGAANAALVAAAYPGGEELNARAATLVVALGLYKLAKSPTDEFTIRKLRQQLTDVYQVHVR